MPQEQAQLDQPGSGSQPVHGCAAGTRLPGGSDGQCFSSSSKGQFDHHGCVSTRAQFPFPLTVPRWALQCGLVRNSTGHPAPVFLFSVACPPLYSPFTSLQAVYDTDFPLLHLQPSKSCRLLFFSSTIQFRGKNILTCIDD